MTYTAHNIPIVEPMMIRKITPLTPVYLAGGIGIIAEYEIEDVGMADERLSFDVDRVDCSNGIFQITTHIMLDNIPHMTAFPSRRWRNFREGNQITRIPDKDNPLLYLGNPVRIITENDSLVVIRSPEFIIKSGIELGF